MNECFLGKRSRDLASEDTGDDDLRASKVPKLNWSGEPGQLILACYVTLQLLLQLLLHMTDMQIVID